LTPINVSRGGRAKPAHLVQPLAHRTEKHGLAKAGLDTGFRANPMRKQKAHRTEKWTPVSGKSDAQTESASDRKADTGFRTKPMR
jgi:uncharacterized protein YaiL (DUF2058 family)